jgi:hypothetical protein
MMNSILLTIFFVVVATAICPHEESGLVGWSTPAAWNDGKVRYILSTICFIELN